ncbi:MAG: septum site-determining protein MinC, partial [Xanthomonadales bacterium]|nr:septum site-determining protein MinC [Xanthomonadales bacterium]
AAGMLPVGLAYGTSALEALAKRLDLPLIAKFRAVYERPHEPAAEAERSPPASAPSTDNHSERHATKHQSQPVRSGQQVYARAGDLAVTASVAPGAELIADGSIHVYGRLSGRALAGALGDQNARIYCTDFRAELVSIAGHYRVLEEIPKQFEGKPVQCRMDGDKLLIEPL